MSERTAKVLFALMVAVAVTGLVLMFQIKQAAIRDCVAEGHTEVLCRGMIWR